jgi:GAF domain-containing protein/CheY-like chemotaxis protein
MREVIDEAGYRTLLALPIEVDGQTWGVLSLISREERRFGPDVLRLLEAVAHQVGVAVARAALYTEERARRAHLAALLEINTKIGALAPTEALLSSIAEEAARLLDVDNAGFRLLDGDELVLAGVAGSAGETMLKPRIKVGESFSGKVVAAGRAMRGEVGDAVIVPEHVAAEHRLGYTHILGVPLKLGARTIGALVFRARRPFSDLDQELAEAFAGQAAVAIEHARLFHETTRRGHEAAELAKLAGNLTQSLNVEDVAERIVEALVPLFGAHSGNLRLLEPDGSLRVIARDDSRSALSPRGDVVPPGFGISSWVARTGQPFRTPDVLAEPDIALSEALRARVVATGDRAYLAVPLRAKDRIIGVVLVSDREGRVFTEAETALLQSFADQAALALENARLYEETERRRREAEVIAEVARGLNEALDLDTVLRRVITAMRELCAADAALIALREPGGDAMRLRHAVGREVPAASWTTRLEPGKGLGGLVLQTGRPMRTDDWLTDPRFTKEYAELVRAKGVVAELAVPILIGGRVEGLVYVQNLTARPFTDRDEVVLAQLADHAAVAVSNANLYAAAGDRAARLRTLNHLNRLVSSSLDTAEVLTDIARAAGEFMNASMVVFWVADNATRTLRAAAVSDPEMGAYFMTRTLRYGEEAAGWAAEHRLPVNIPDVFASDSIVGSRDWLDAHGIRSLLAIPVLHNDAVLAVVTLTAREPFRLGPDDHELLESFLAQATGAIRNAALYTEVQERLRQTRTLLAVAEALSKPGAPDDVMRTVAREVGRATSADMVGAYFMNEKKDALRALAGYHVPTELLPVLRDRSMQLSTFPFVADALARGRPMWSPDPLHDPRFDPAWIEGLPPHAVLFVPTLTQGQPLGGLFLVWWQVGRPFPAAEVPIVEGVAAQLGLALENAELSRKTRSKLRETEALLSVSHALASTLDLEAMLRHFMREAARMLGADSMAFWTAAEDGEWLEPFAGYHVPPERLEEFRTLRVSMVEHAFYAEAVQRRRPALTVLGRDDPRLPEHVRALPHRSQLFVPIVAKERVIGALAAVWWTTARELSDSEFTLLEALASQVGVAVENARLFTENRRQVQELSALYDLSRAVTGELDRAALVEAIHTHLARVVDVRNMVVLIRDPDAGDIEVALRIVDGAHDDRPPHRYPLQGIGLMRFVLEEGRPLRTADYAAECARRGVAPVAYGLRFTHWLGVPMKVGDHVLGALALRTVERAYTEADERLLANVADLAALALRSARLYDERARAFGELSAAQDQLVRTEKLRALGEMASGVAHDFNNLLAAILGRAQLLLQRIEDPRLRKWIQVIERSALDGAQTVRRLQEFTRIRRDQPFVVVDLNQVVRDALEITRSRWRDEPMSRGIRIDVRTSFGDIPAMAGDPVELREALTNLILNAVDAMPDGGTLALRTARADGLVELTVSDTGVGMPETVRQRIFDPFFTTKGAQGTGLGLSITYGILMRHRARVSVETEPGQGTAFRLAFEPGAAVGVAEPAAPVSAPTGVPLRCLVVDDEESVGTVLGDVLETGGHSVVVLSSGAEAIERFRREPFDVVFTDLAMPGLSGWQVARAVKAAAPTVPVFLVTGFGVELSADERRAHGVDLVLSKPLNIQSVLDAVALAATRTQAG